jgi:Glycosyl hydrolases family 25
VTIFFPDVSQFTPGANLAGAPAVACRASEGNWLLDSSWPAYQAAARSHGVPFFAYHVLEASSSASQAQHCHARVGKIPLMMDVEKAGSSTPRIGDITGFVRAYRALGGVTWLCYLPHWYWQSIGSPSLTPLAQLGISLWSSAYPGSYSDAGGGWAPYGGLTPAIWQWTDHHMYGSVATDQNAFKGTPAQLVSLFTTGKTSSPAPIKPPAPPPAPPDEEDEDKMFGSVPSDGTPEVVSWLGGSISQIVLVAPNWDKFANAAAKLTVEITVNHMNNVPYVTTVDVPAASGHYTAVYGFDTKADVNGVMLRVLGAPVPAAVGFHLNK